LGLTQNEIKFARFDAPDTA